MNWSFVVDDNVFKCESIKASIRVETNSRNKSMERNVNGDEESGRGREGGLR